MSPPQLNSLLLLAAVDLDEDVIIYGQHMPSAGPEYTYSLDQGVDIWLLKVSGPQGYLSYGQMRTMITGLQIYMVIGDRLQAIRFRVLYGPNDAVLGHGAVGDLRPPSPPRSNTTAKRGFQVSSLNSNAASSMSIAQDSTTPNVSKIPSSLLTIQIPNSSLPDGGNAHKHFQVPDTQMTLVLTKRNRDIDYHTLQALLTGANNSIYQQIDLHGESAVITGRNFRYYLEDQRVVLEVLSWQRAPNAGLTWMQMAEIVEGLALFIVEERIYSACFFNAVYGDQEETVGIGKIARSLALSE